jgi:predicted TIM-barrel fold metal-dependent hydrolase
MIIDFRVTPPIREWMDPEEAKQVFPNSYMRGYLESEYEAAAMISVTVEDMIKAMDEAGVTYGVLQAEWAIGDYKRQNDAVYRMAQKYPKKFPRYYLTINPLTDDNPVKLIEKEVKERGFSGLNTQTFAQRMRPNDKRLYPVYAKCQELGIPVTFHASINFTIDRTIDFSRPLYLDEVACDFPDLVIVGNHGGWPWVTEMIAVAWKHRNVYIEYGAVSPKYIGKPGTGWEPLIVYGNSLLQDRVLFATDDMIPFKRAVDETRELPLKEEVKKKWLGLNAARILGLEQKQ